MASSKHTQLLGALLLSVHDGLPDLMERLPGAISVVKQAQGTLGAVDPSAGPGGPANDISDPTAAAALNSRSDEARADRRRIEAHIRAISEEYRRLVLIIDEYNPGPELQAEFRDARDMTNDNLWCENHQRYGHHETRRPGSRNCGWCDKTKASKHKQLPNRALIEAHYRSNRLTDQDYRRLLAIPDPESDGNGREGGAGKAAS